jgi:hypothetical protein
MLNKVVTEDDLRQAAEALRKRLAKDSCAEDSCDRDAAGEDAVRFLLKHYNIDNLSSSYGFSDDERKEFIQLSRLPAKTPEQFALALADARKDNWSREARAPLPDDLQVIALEYRYYGHKEYKSEKEVLEGFVQDNDCDLSPEQLLSHIGLTSVHSEQETTRFFGPRRYLGQRLRVDIIVRKSSLEQIRKEMFEFTRVRSPIDTGEAGLELIGYEILNTMAHRYEIGDEPKYEWRLHMDNDALDSDVPGNFAKWAAAEARRSELILRQYLQLYDAYNGNLIQMLKALERHWAEPTGPQSFLVEGLIARGVVTLLLGKKGAGKTNIALELAVDAAERRCAWLGFPLKPSAGVVVYLYGEDSEENVKERVRAMNDGELPLMLDLIKYDGRRIGEIIAELSNTKVELVLIDPARKFYQGDEDGSDAVSAFFTQVEKLAHRKKAAVLVCHHLKRGASPKNIHEVPHWMRGSQVFIDRPRTILALHRTGDKTLLGIPAPNGGDPLHNLKASIMFSGMKRLRRDETTFRHVPHDDHAKADQTDQKPNASAEERVLAALHRLVKKGATVTSGDERELFTWNPPELEGMSRATMRKIVKQLVADGRIVRRTSGALVPKEASEAEAVQRQAAARHSRPS